MCRSPARLSAACRDAAAATYAHRSPARRRTDARRGTRSASSCPDYRGPRAAALPARAYRPTSARPQAFPASGAASADRRASPGGTRRSRSIDDLAHRLVKCTRAFEADAGQLRHHDVPVLDAHVVREAAEWLKQVRIVLVAAEPEAGCDRERHLMSAVRNAARARPAGRLDGLERALVFAQAVGERAVELQPVAVGAHAAVAQQVARILVAEQILAGRHRRRIELGERRLQRVVERVARLLV